MADITRRGFLRMSASAALGVPAALAGCSRRTDEKVINFFNYSNYIGNETLPRFERETGIKINYDVYSNEEEMAGKLKAGVQGYDLVVATDHMLPSLKALQLISPIPWDELKNLDNIDKRFRDPIFDPGLAYSVPYLWGTTGIGFNQARLKRAPNSWRDLWNPEYRGRMSMLDNVHDGIGAVLLMLGLPPNTKDPGDLAKVREALLKQKPLLKQYASATYIDDLSAGEIWLTQGWSGDVLQAIMENKQIDYVIPKEGSLMAVDSICMLRGSAREDVLRFMDYLLQPDVAAEISNTVRYPTPNVKAKPLLDPALVNDPRVYPTPEIEKRLQFDALLDPETDELWNQLWQEIKLG